MMDDIYQYPVFFECNDLLGEQIKKVQRYFCIRRRSGGGDCGSLTCVNDKVYSVAFKYEKDQQAVLQKHEHVVEFADGHLVFTVRGSLGLTVSPTTSSSASHVYTAPVESPQSIPASTPPPSGGNYELQLDLYLLRYLKESPNAGKELEKELSSVACSAKLYPEDERALVRCLAQPGAEDEVRNWTAEVDKVFDGYLCHYEVDPHKVKSLLQSCSSRQVTDEVKVYSEVGMAVVVGKRSQVKARLMDVEHSRVKQGSSLSEKQTSIRRLGTAKLRLLWTEIEHSLGRDFPGVKVTQGDAGQLVLEGSVEEILKAGDQISDMESLVSERTVSDMSPHFLAFLRRAYGGPGVLSDILGFGDKVEVELRDTELRLFSCSAEKLDETEKKLQEKFKEVKIYVPNCSAVLPELQEKLKSKTNEMNRGQHRAQVVFGLDSTVFLLGHTKEVEELSETVTQFILDQSCVQSIVDLPFPELAQELPELLQLHGFDSSGGITRQNLASGARIYSLCGGHQGLVCQCDITEQDADALVNAANEDLKHFGGVSAALSQAGCPEAQMSSPKTVILLGKSGSGKSNLANTIFGEELFITNHSSDSETTKCQAKTKSVNGRSITLIDTPGLYDTERSEKDINREIVSCITECAPGPHAFLIVLKVEKFTEQEQAVINKIFQSFSEDALKYAVIVFTHGDQLPKGMKIEEFVSQNKNLSDLVKRCGGRCHVIDNKYWKNKQQNNYRSNQFQVAEILNTIDKMTKVNKGSCYTNEMLQVVKREIHREEECIRLSSGNMSQKKIRIEAKINVFERLLIRSAGIATGALLGALLGVAEMVASTVGNFQNPSDVSALVSTERGRATVASAAQHGAVKGVLTGYNAAEGAETPGEAIQKTVGDVWNQCRIAANLNISF